MVLLPKLRVISPSLYHLFEMLLKLSNMEKISWTFSFIENYDDAHLPPQKKKNYHPMKYLIVEDKA